MGVVGKTVLVHCLFTTSPDTFSIPKSESLPHRLPCNIQAKAAGILGSLPRQHSSREEKSQLDFTSMHPAFMAPQQIKARRGVLGHLAV